MRIAGIVCLGFVCAAGTVWAQSDESLLIGAGDIIHIQVLEAPELGENARVMDSGEVPLIVGGNVKVAGFTPDGAAQLIRADLAKENYLIDPHVIVNIEQYATQQVSVLGEVKSPGRFQFGTPQPLATVLAQAGGLSEAADRNITIQRRLSGKKENYFVANNASEVLDSHITVYPGDTIFVPRVKLVYVLGDVYHAGGYPMSPDTSQITVMKALALAGWAQLHARESHARLIRKQDNGGYVEIPVNLSDLEKGKRGDIAMQADDILYVPFSYAKNVSLNLTQIMASAGAATVYGGFHN